jgi:RHH-type proline utilization regulon transcriptional repressor/proline dehydrogenase/delta 1-pyrroline-5-carboxylate dehydrogenase
MEHTPVGVTVDLPGPVGERNVYRLEPRGAILCIADGEAAALRQISAALATGKRALVQTEWPLLSGLPAPLREWISVVGHRAQFDAVLFSGDDGDLRKLNQELAQREGPLTPVYGKARDLSSSGTCEYPLEWLVKEQSVSTNTAAAGGNAHLMMVG